MVGDKIYIVKILKVITVTEYDRMTRKAIEQSVEVYANHIVEDDDYITFYDKWDDVSGRFRKDSVIGYFYKR